GRDRAARRVKDIAWVRIKASAGELGYFAQQEFVRSVILQFLLRAIEANFGEGSRLFERTDPEQALALTYGNASAEHAIRRLGDRHWSLKSRRADRENRGQF